MDLTADGDADMQDAALLFIHPSSPSFPYKLPQSRSTLCNI